MIEFLLPPQYSAPTPARALLVNLNSNTPEGNTTILSAQALPAGADEQGHQGIGFPTTPLGPRLSHGCGLPFSSHSSRITHDSLTLEWRHHRPRFLLVLFLNESSVSRTHLTWALCGLFHGFACQMRRQWSRLQSGPGSSYQLQNGRSFSIQKHRGGPGAVAGLIKCLSWAWSSAPQRDQVWQCTHCSPQHSGVRGRSKRWSRLPSSE